MSNLSSHNLNSNTVNNSRITSCIGQRTIVPGGLNLPVNQCVGMNMKPETFIINSSTTPLFGSSHMYNISEKNIVVHGATLKLELPPLSGTNSFSGVYVPGQFMAERCNIVINGQVFDVIVDVENFLRLNLYKTDADRLSSNQGSGLYNSVPQRLANISSTTVNNIILIPLKCSFFDVVQPAILNDAHAIQMNVVMASQSQCVDVISGTLTSNSNIISSSLILKITRLSLEDSMLRLKSMQVRRFDTIYHSIIPTTYTASAGSTSSTFVLSNLMNQNVMQLLVVLRSSKQGAQQYNFMRVNTMNILDGASNSLTGGPLNSSYLANIQNRDISVSSYNTETSMGLNNNGANYYCFPFSCDPVASLQNGQILGNRRMMGNESVVITYVSALTSSIIVDVFAYVESYLQQGVSGYIKV